jgi:anti-sigma B factor antagonist
MMTDSHSNNNIIRGIRHEGQAAVLELSGEIDMKCFIKLRSKFRELYQERPQVLIVDMTHVKFMDSSGLATLVGALKWCRQNGSELKLVGLTQRVRSIFEICRLESIFQIYNTEAEALSQ